MGFLPCSSTVDVLVWRVLIIYTRYEKDWITTELSLSIKIQFKYLSISLSERCWYKLSILNSNLWVLLLILMLLPMILMILMNLIFVMLVMLVMLLIWINLTYYLLLLELSIHKHSIYSFTWIYAFQVCKHSQWFNQVGRYLDRNQQYLQWFWLRLSHWIWKKLIFPHTLLCPIPTIITDFSYHFIILVFILVRTSVSCYCFLLVLILDYSTSQ